MMGKLLRSNILRAWLSFWCGVVVALVLLAFVGWQFAVLAFALGLLLTVIFALKALAKGVNNGIKAARELAEEGQARRFTPPTPPAPPAAPAAPQAPASPAPPASPAAPSAPQAPEPPRMPPTVPPMV